MRMMTAAVVEEHGDIDQVKVRPWPVPEPQPHEVRIRVSVAALNRADLGLVRGLSGPGLREKRLPLVPGVDFAGAIDALGAEAEAAGWRLGDRVTAYPAVFCGRCWACRQGEESMCDHYQIIGEESDGGLAEYVVVPSINLKHVPDHVPFEVAAASPVAFTTAWRMLFHQAQLQPGQSLLVVGVGSGVSTAAIALARRVGARVLGTTRDPAKVAPALELGCEAVLAGYEQPFDDWVMALTDGAGVDVVADSVGAATWRASIRSLRMGGAMVICGATSGDDPSFSIREIYQRHRRVLGAPCGNLREFHRALDLVFAGEVAPVLDHSYPLSEVHDALRRLEAHDQFGKVLVRP